MGNESAPRCVADPGPFQSVAVPDQRRTTSALPLREPTSTILARSCCTASGTRALKVTPSSPWSGPCL